MCGIFAGVPKDGRILIGGMAAILSAVGVGIFLFLHFPLASAPILSITYAAVLLFQLEDDFQNDSLQMGHKWTYIILAALWVPTFYSALNLLIWSGSGPTVPVGRVIVSVLGIGLLQGLSTSQSGVVLLALGVLFFRTSNGLSKTAWGLVDDIVSD